MELEPNEQDFLKFCKETNYEKNSVERLNEFLRSGVAATVTEIPNGAVDDSIGLTPLHIIIKNFPEVHTNEQLENLLLMIDLLFEWGAGWIHVDENGDSPGCICLKRKLPNVIYEKFVNAGTRSEILLRKLSGTVLSDDNVETVENNENTEKVENINNDLDDSNINNKSYLASKLTYTDHSLITSVNDGVMMDWEDEIMKKSAKVLIPDKKLGKATVLNVGFGMGIIDRYLQEREPKVHYIVEPHQDVLKEMEKRGWMDKPNIVVLKGRWQDVLPEILEKNVFFDGIYYDTFSETYNELVEFFDLVVGLLAPDGIFSFFNGLGADRQICYDVYSNVVAYDLEQYGLQIKYEDIPIDLNIAESDESNSQDGVWEGIRRQYWTLKLYKLPICTFFQ